MILTVALLAGIASATRSDAAPQRLQSPQRAELVRAAAFPHSTLTSDGVRRVLGATQWGGEFTADGGQVVTVFVSGSYPEDPAVAQRWANFLAGLVHGPELARVTAYLAPLREVQRLCGEDALACYSPRDEFLVAPGEDPESDVSAEAVVAHEYGHHVAASRSNAPWRAVDWGTKRWASYLNVCARARAGELFPGSQQIPRYRLNPGEAFAEAYRVLNQRRAGVSETAWSLVSSSLYPDDRSLALLEEDVVRPWTKASTRSYRARATRTTRTRTFRVATPLDGTLTATVRAPRGARLELQVYAGTRQLARVRTAKGASRRLTTTVCGDRSLRLRVRALAGAGALRLDVARP